MKLTREFIMSGRSEFGGWNAKQLATLGILWPPKKGWITRLESKEITDESAQNFLFLRKANNKPAETDSNNHFHFCPNCGYPLTR